MRHPNVSQGRPWLAAGVNVLAGMALLLGIGAGLAIPSIAQAQQNTAPATPSSKDALSASDSAACTQVISYAFQNPQVFQAGQRLQNNPKAAVFLRQPDSVRTRIAAAVAQGQGDTLKAIARRVLDDKTASEYDGFLDLVVASPDSIRKSLATLVTRGRLLDCSQ